MPRRLTNLLLLGLVTALAGSGLVGWIVPEASAPVWYVLHRALGVALVLTLLWKLPIVGGSLRRRLGRPGLCRSIVPGALAICALATTLTLGLGWTLSIAPIGLFGGYVPLNVHVLAGLALLPLMLWHLSRRWERQPPVRTFGRRRVLARLGALALGTLAGLPLVDRLAAAQDAEGLRRPSGSRHVGSFDASLLPVTIWQFDAIPAIAAEEWRLEVVGGGVSRTTLTLADLAALPSREVDAVLDCTSGWWSEQRWRGYGVGEVLALAGLPADDRLVDVVSTTGHCWTFPLADLRGMLLATHVDGALLAPGHGAPVRLVAPGRRGFQWVKWVMRIEVR